MGDSTDMAKQLQGESITQVNNVSHLLRDAISAAIPVAPEQYMTIAIPGTVIDVRDLNQGGTFVYSAENTAFPPMQVRQAEARLCDNMAPLSNVMVGNTGKSVARSYSRALDFLVPKKATIKDGDEINPIRSPGEKGYDAAMKYLTSIDPETDQNPVDVYMEKQSAWAKAQESWDKARIRAQKESQTKFPDDIVKQKQDYDEWNQANYRKYKFAVQGKWMDWISNGHKYNVEFNFGMVDTESIMARIENSKESIRNSTIVDSDGANEVQGIILTPKNWATLCQQKQLGWFKRNGNYSLEQIDAEIERLQRLSLSYEVLKTLSLSPAPATPTYPISDPSKAKPTNTEAKADEDLTAKFTALYNAEAALATQDALISGEDGATAEASREKPEYRTLKTNVRDAQKALNAEIKANMKNHFDWTKYNIASMDTDAKASMTAWLDKKEAAIADQIAKLKEEKTAKQATQPLRVPAIADADAEEDKSGTIVAAEGSELADPIFNIKIPAAYVGEDIPEAGSESDPWTTISVSYSAEDQKATSNTSSWGMSVGAGFGYGLWSFGGSYAHSQSRSDSKADMANCDVSITFDALVVNIGRPWLYAELFNDFELDVADKVYLSPGAERLKELIASQSAKVTQNADAGLADQSVLSELAQFNSFPAFPTSFIVAANTNIEFNGNTQHIQDHFSAQSDSGSVAFGYGPFSVRSSFEHSSSEQTHQMHATATGCKLTFGAPQVIGWVSQIVPELPRRRGLEPMVQNLVLSKAT